MFHIVSVLLINKQEKQDLLEAGVTFNSVIRVSDGESVSFQIPEGDPRWQKVEALLCSFKGNHIVPKEHRVRYRQASVSWDETAKIIDEKVANLKAFKKSLPGPKWLDGYSGESLEQLLSLESGYRTDSLVLAFEQAIDLKVAREGAKGLTNGERAVLAVEALEREINNGGYDQFFSEFVAGICIQHSGFPEAHRLYQDSEDYPKSHKGDGHFKSERGCD